MNSLCNNMNSLSVMQPTEFFQYTRNQLYELSYEEGKHFMEILGLATKEKAEKLPKDLTIVFLLIYRDDVLFDGVSEIGHSLLDELFDIVEFLGIAEKIFEEGWSISKIITTIVDEYINMAD